MASTGSIQKGIKFHLRPGERKIILLTGDVVMASLALLITLYFWAQRDWLYLSKEFFSNRIPPWFYFLPFFWLILNVEMYDVRRAGRRSETIKGVGIAAGVSLILYLFVFFLSDPGSLPRRGVAIFIVSSLMLMLAWRFTYISVFTTPQFMRRVLIIGAGRAGTTLVEIFKEIWPPPFYLVGMIDDDPMKQDCYVEGFPILGDSGNMLEVVEQHKVTDFNLRDYWRDARWNV